MEDTEWRFVRPILCGPLANQMLEIHGIRDRKCCVLSCFMLCTELLHLHPTLYDSMTIAWHLFMGILGARIWSRLPCPLPGDLPDPGIESVSLYVSCIGRWVLYPQCHLESPLPLQPKRNFIFFPKHWDKMPLQLETDQDRKLICLRLTQVEC